MLICNVGLFSKTDYNLTQRSVASITGAAGQKNQQVKCPQSDLFEEQILQNPTKFKGEKNLNRRNVSLFIKFKF